MKSEENFTKLNRENVFFFDSYAILEIIFGNENYTKYCNSLIFTTKNNLFEVYYNLLRNNYQGYARKILERYYHAKVDFEKETIIEAGNFKLKYRKKRLSMVDCIGYVLAKKLEIKFLTGDKEFIDLENVEFVK